MPLPTTSVWLAELVPVLLIIAVPFSVHAGVLSSLFGVEAAEPAALTDGIPAETASDVRLLSAGNTPDPVTALGGGDIIVDEGALVSSGQSGEDLIAQEAYQSGEISVYVVREGDTLSQIAEMFEVTSNTILWANDLRSSKDIHPGDSLVILPIVGVRHIVKDGDTINTIAKKYEGDVDEILSYNQLASADGLSVGDTLVIPGGNMHQAAPTRSVAASGSGGNARLSHPLPGAKRTQGIHGYNAVDLAMSGNSYGAPIFAAAAGEVIVSKSSGWNGGYGQYIVVKHSGGVQTLYSHLSKNSVGVGAYVTAGEVIGAVGNSGKSTGAHLHFEVRGATNPF